MANTLAEKLIGVGMPPEQAALLQAAIQGTGAPGDVTIVTVASHVIEATTYAIAVERAAPTATTLYLPAVLLQENLPLRIADWSSGVEEHTITVVPSAGETVSRASSWSMVSNPAYLASAVFYPSVELNGWYVQ